MTRQNGMCSSICRRATTRRSGGIRPRTCCTRRRYGANMVTPATDGERWRPPIEDVLDPVFGRVGVPPMIVVIPDGDSTLRLRPVGGLAGDRVLRAVRHPGRDPATSTSPTGRSRRQRSRGVFGFSSGGFGSWNLASRNPDVFGAMAVLSADSWLDMTHKFMLYKYLDSIWPEAPNGPVEGNFWSEIVYDYSATYSPNLDNPPFYVDSTDGLAERRTDPGGVGPLAQLRPGRQLPRPCRQPAASCPASCSTPARTTTTTCTGATGCSATI